MAMRVDMATDIKTGVALKLCRPDCLGDTVLAHWLDASTLNDPTALLSDKVLPLRPCPPQALAVAALPLRAQCGRVWPVLVRVFRL